MWTAITKPVVASPGIAIKRAFFPVAIVVLAAVFLSEFLDGQFTQLLIGASAICLTAKRDKSHRRYGVAALGFIVLALFVPVKTVWYFGAAMALFFWAEAQGYRIGFLGLTASAISSPAFGYGAAVFSFPVRMQLANWVGAFFSMVTNGVAVQGNTILAENGEFTIDPACMGLYMLSVSVLMGICLIGALQRKLGKRVTLAAAAGFLAAVFVLNVLANAIRIVVLVQFAILPENVLHEVVGLGCLMLYVCLPSFFLARWLVRRSQPPSANVDSAVQRSAIRWQLALIALLLIAGVRVAKADTYADFVGKENISVAGYTPSLYAPGIIKLESADALVYVKYIRGFYDTDHNPTICWKGSGYAFEDVQPQTLCGQIVFTAMLNNGAEKLYTAWWYGNGKQCTINQLDWRKAMLTGGEEYAVVNVTAGTKEGLMKQLQAIIGGHQLKPLFQ